MIQLRPYEPARDYPTMQAWWAGHNAPATPAGALPKLGLLAVVDDRETFAAWASMDNSCGLSYLLWPVSNPMAPSREVARCIGPTLDLLKSLVRDFGYHTMLAMTHSESLAAYFPRNGFTSDVGLIRLHSANL